MHILLTNDDGIGASGLLLLAKYATQISRVTIVAPEKQMSAMSQGITLRNSITVRRADYPVKGVKAYAVSGTPADCVKVALSAILADDMPGYVFSGINYGLNVGYDIEYSGTIAAAMEALMYGVPACAWSLEKNETQETETCEIYLPPLMEDILASPMQDAIWNINFPSCPESECEGILTDRTPAHMQLIHDGFGLVSGRPIRTPWDSSPVTHVLQRLSLNEKAEIWNIGNWTPAENVPEGTDLSAIQHKYVSVGVVHSPVL